MAPTPSARTAMFGTRVPQDTQIGVLNRLVFDSVAQTNWCCSEAIATAGVGMDCRPSGLGARTDIGARTSGLLRTLVFVAGSDLLHQPVFTSIFLACCCAFALLGSVTDRTPFLKFASILSSSMSSGN